VIGTVGVGKWEVDVLMLCSISNGYEAEYNLEFFETRLMRLDSVRISSEPIDTQHRAK